MDLLPINTSMSRFDECIQTHADSKDGSRLQTEIADVWRSIRGQKLYSGQPRTSHSDGAIARSMAAFKLASQSNNRGLLAEPSRLMANTTLRSNITGKHGRCSSSCRIGRVLQ